MTWQTITSNWPTYQDKFKTNFTRLADEEVAVTHGERTKLIDKVRDAYHLSQEEAEKEVDVWMKSLEA